MAPNVIALSVGEQSSVGASKDFVFLFFMTSRIFSVQ